MTAAAYAPLLERTETQVHLDLDVEDAIKLVTRIRKVSLFLRVTMPLITERDEEAGTYRYFDNVTNIPASAAQVQKVLADTKHTAEMRVKAGKAAGKVEVTRLGGCLFFG